MDVKTFLLGLLALGEASGYEIKKRLEGPFSHFYDASYGSIYPALTKLAKDGLVDCESLAQDGRPDKKIYRISPAGRMALIDALGEPLLKDKVRSDFLARMMFAALMEPRHLEGLITERLESHRAVLAEIASDEMGLADLDDSNDQNSLKFVVGFGDAINRAAADYIEENRHLLEASAFVRREPAAAE